MATAVKEKLKIFFGDHTEDFCKWLQQSGAIVAGGFVTSCLVKYDVPQAFTYTQLNELHMKNIRERIVDTVNDLQKTDLDIYVHTSRRNMILYLVSHFGLKWIAKTLQPPYDQSFLRENGVLNRIEFEQTTINGPVSVDVMVTQRTPIETASNFDLTCCEVWFDGVNVGGTHLEQTLAKQAFLRPSYTRAFVAKNMFTHGRVSKYMERGFTVTIPPHVPRPETSIEIDSRSSVRRKYGDAEEVVVKMMIECWYRDNWPSSNIVLHERTRMYGQVETTSPPKVLEVGWFTHPSATIGYSSNAVQVQGVTYPYVPVEYTQQHLEALHKEYPFAFQDKYVHPVLLGMLSPEALVHIRSVNPLFDASLVPSDRQDPVYLEMNEMIKQMNQYNRSEIMPTHPVLLKELQEGEKGRYLSSKTIDKHIGELEVANFIKRFPEFASNPELRMSEYEYLNFLKLLVTPTVFTIPDFFVQTRSTPTETVAYFRCAYEYLVTKQSRRHSYEYPEYLSVFKTIAAKYGISVGNLYVEDKDIHHTYQQQECAADVPGTIPGLGCELPVPGGLPVPRELPVPGELQVPGVVSRVAPRSRLRSSGRVPMRERVRVERRQREEEGSPEASPKSSSTSPREGSPIVSRQFKKARKDEPMEE